MSARPREPGAGLRRPFGLLRALLITLSLALLTPAGGALAEEVILSFDSEVEVLGNGDLLVTETIRVRAEGAQIRRGIFRDFPTILRRPSGLVERHGFDVIAVSRDGQPEPFRTESVTGGKRVYIGAEAVLLAPGEYRYQIKYRTTREVRHLADLDEVYWNVTGNGWAFPIKQVRASITLPAPVGFARSAFYTGPRGATGQDARVIDQDQQRIRFETTRPLAVGEGLTVAAAFEKGLVPAADANADTLRLTLDNLGFFALIGLPPLLALYLFGRWVRVGRDPPRGVIIPLFAPPAGMSPAVASWVYWRGTGAKVRGVSRALVAALMSLAVQGRVILMDHSPGLTIRRARKQRGADDQLALEERTLEDDLLGRTGNITIEPANETAVRYAVTNFDNTLNRACAGKFYRFNWSSIAIGAVLSLVAALAFFLLYAPNDSQIMIFFAALGAGVIGGNLLVRGLRRIGGDTPGASTTSGWLMAALGLLVLGAFIAPLAWPELSTRLLGQTGLPLPPAEVFTPPATRAVAVAVLTIVLLNLAFGVLLFAPTPLGRKAADDLAGFRHYLEVAEAERMNLPGRPDFTTELFERYLPYAIGLGVEKPWARALDAHLARGLPGDRDRDYQPDFYSGRDFDAARVGATTAAIASTLGASFSAAMPSSSDSGGGSGGGGSSGGGGGGGGGGGW